MKYIVIQDPETKQEKIFIFPRFINHNDYYDLTKYIKIYKGRDWERPFIDWEAVSAGFVNISSSEGLICEGYSETLGLKSRPAEDLFLLHGSWYHSVTDVSI
jgi:hypothetical protein